MKSIARKIILGIIIGVCTGILVVVIYDSWQEWQANLWQKKTDDFQAALTKPYREDTFGGKTPEETWTMFLDALKKGDVELASKYFVVEKQEEAKNEVREILLNLDSALRNFSTFEKEKEIPDGIAYYHIKMPFSESSSGHILSPIIFTLNPYTRVWKISVL